MGWCSLDAGVALAPDLELVALVLRELGKEEPDRVKVERGGGLIGPLAGRVLRVGPAVCE